MARNPMPAIYEALYEKEPDPKLKNKYSWDIQFPNAKISLQRSEDFALEIEWLEETFRIQTCLTMSHVELPDFDNDVMPRVSTSLSIRRVETPSR